MLDVIIVGGGPAGLSAALLLGRSRPRARHDERDSSAESDEPEAAQAAE